MQSMISAALALLLLIAGSAVASGPAAEAMEWRRPHHEVITVDIAQDMA